MDQRGIALNIDVFDSAHQKIEELFIILANKPILKTAGKP